MTSILMQIIIALNLLYGKGDYTTQAQQIYNSKDYTYANGVVIIDTDELCY
jgi:hypothetical protein